MERFLSGEVVTVVNATGSPHLKAGETRIIAKVDAQSGFVRVMGCDEWLWDGRFKRVKLPKPIANDADGNAIGAGDLVECVDVTTCDSREITKGKTYVVAGIPRGDIGCVTITDDCGFATSWFSDRFRKLSPTPLDKREDA